MDDFQNQTLGQQKSKYNLLSEKVQKKESREPSKIAQTKLEAFFLLLKNGTSFLLLTIQSPSVLA